MQKQYNALDEISIDTIYEHTHITKKTINLILNKEFDSISPVQFNGFVTIIEREFKIDLTELKIEYNLSKQIKIEESTQELAPVAKKESHKNKYITLAIISLVLLSLFIYMFTTSKKANLNVELNNSSIKAAKEKIETIKTTPIVVEQKVYTSSSSSEAEKKVIKQIRIIPKSKLWVGIINLESNKKRQLTTSEAIELNASHNYLFAFGHGYLSIALDDNTTEFSEKRNVRFKYENHTLTQISLSEFKALNRGKNW